MTKSVIFDLDGTLIDSKIQISKNFNLVLSEFGYKQLHNEVFHKNIGLPPENFLHNLSMPDFVKQQIILKFRETMFADTKGIVVYPFVIQILELLQRNNYLLGIATTKPTKLAKSVVENSELKGYFHCIQGTDDFMPKPNPAVILRCQAQLRTITSIMVGDRVEDIRAAVAANIPSVGVAQGFHSKEKLKRSGASLVVINMKDLFDQLLEGDLYSRLKLK
jgi:phosphoglycolate phosphatase-like HAD superfamily hydrolase